MRSACALFAFSPSLASRNHSSGSSPAVSSVSRTCTASRPSAAAPGRVFGGCKSTQAMRNSVRATRLLRGDLPPRESISTLRLRATGRKKSMCACNGRNHSVHTPCRGSHYFGRNPGFFVRLPCR